MARTKRIIDSEIKGEMKSVSQTWKKFRTDNALTQKFLSEIVGVSRRTIQSIESGGIIPQEVTIAKFEELRKKYEKNGRVSRKSLRKTKFKCRKTCKTIIKNSKSRCRMLFSKMQLNWLRKQL